MRVVFRLDAGKETGIGHLMRCLALSEEIIKNGGKCYFLSRIQGKGLKQKIKKNKSFLKEIDKKLSWDEDCELAIDFCKKNNIDWFVTDHYGIKEDYIKKIKKEGFFVLSIDDNANIFYDSDIVVNQNIGAEKLGIKTNKKTKLLLGTKYVILRDELLKAKRQKSKNKVKNILITLGGTDKNNVASKVIESIEIKNNEIIYTVLIGPLGNKIDSNKNIKILFSPKSMAEVYSKSDIAISSGGTTCYELLYFGVPNIIITTADNQLNIARNLDKEKTSIYAGEMGKINFEEIVDKTELLIKNKKLRKEMAKKGMELIDGKGKERIVKEMNNYKIIKLRKAILDDAELLWKWRNEQSVRESAFSSEKIEYSSHKEWYKYKLKNPDTYFFIAIDSENKPVGQIRFDKLDKNSAEVDVSVDKNNRNKGYGSIIIQKGCNYLSNNTAIKKVISKVKKNNVKSIKAFSNAGFKIIKEGKFNNHEIVEMEFKIS